MEPAVSVIIPVYNDATRLRFALLALKNQTLDSNAFEVIVIDNGSSDHPENVVMEMPSNFKIIKEDKILGSSDAARNAGIKLARGAVLAFTDSDCKPDIDWLESGLKSMKASKAEMIAGKIRFFSEGRPTLSEICDSITFLQNQQAVLGRGVGFFANMFIKRDVFERIGYLDPKLLQSGDVEICLRAKKYGIQVIYSELPIVSHPTRRFLELFKKSVRVGEGKAANGIAESRSLIASPKSFPHIQNLNLLKVFKKLEFNDFNLKLGNFDKFQVWMISCLVIFGIGIGFIRYNLPTMSKYRLQKSC